VQIAGASTAVDITSDLLDLTIDESIENRGSKFSITLDDSSNRYLDTFFIAKGTLVNLTITPQNWGVNLPIYNSGAFWIDDIRYSLRPAEATFSATSIPPDLLLHEKHHKGTEGKTVTTQQTQVAQADGMESLDATTSAPDPARKRDDQDNVPDGAQIVSLAKSQGKRVFTQYGKLVVASEEQLEAQVPTLFIQKGITPIISGNFHTTVGKTCAGTDVAYFDAQTGKVVYGAFTPNTIPDGVYTRLKSRERPPFSGTDNSAPTDPDPLGEGEVSEDNQ
jgi:hypothetical protein